MTAADLLALPEGMTVWVTYERDGRLRMNQAVRVFRDLESTDRFKQPCFCLCGKFDPPMGEFFQLDSVTEANQAWRDVHEGMFLWHVEEGG